MPGPAPKSKDERRRRNKPQSGEWVTLPRTHDREAPGLPKVQGVRWLKSTKDWWATIWRSPMASQWQESDVFGLVELAVMRQAFFEGDLRLADKITAKSDKFGLTPKGRKDLRWIVTEEDAESAGAKPALASVRSIRPVDPSA